MATIKQTMDQLMGDMEGEEGEEGEGQSCPTATQDITINLRNRAKAINSADYGPENPDLPNTAFWKAKASQWEVSIEDAKMSRCGNCAAFNQDEGMLECIAKGIGDEGDADEVIDDADLGYCEIFDFKCAASRTCDAWVTDSDEGEEEEEEDEDEREGAAMEGDDNPMPMLVIKIGKKS